MAKVEERRVAELTTKAAFAAKLEDIKRMVNDNAANQEAMQEADARLQAGPSASPASMQASEPAFADLKRLGMACAGHGGCDQAFGRRHRSHVQLA